MSILYDVLIKGLRLFDHVEVWLYNGLSRDSFGQIACLGIVSTVLLWRKQHAPPTSHVAPNKTYIVFP
jgi:hypothetical protein